MLYNKTFKNLVRQKANNNLFVFFVINPICVVVSRLIIEKLNLDKKNILIISFRNTDLSLLNCKSLMMKKNKFERIFEKLTLMSIAGNKILSKINHQKFIIFASWSFKEVNWLLKSPNCNGHYYIEEGSAAYRIHNPYSYKKISLKTHVLNNLKNRVNDGQKEDLAFRDDALGYIGISDQCFPQISTGNKVILSNIIDLKKIYKPKLIGIKYIGLTCAERRLKNNNWQGMIDKLVKILPNNSAIKAHPSLMVSSNKIKSVTDYVKNISEGKIKLCSNNIIIELEMLYEEKVIFGPISSLLFYTNLFGSEYRKIKLY